MRENDPTHDYPPHIWTVGRITQNNFITLAGGLQKKQTQSAGMSSPTFCSTVFIQFHPSHQISFSISHPAKSDYQYTNIPFIHKNLKAPNIYKKSEPFLQ